jgi:predicted nucleotidyltransferase
MDRITAFCTKWKVSGLSLFGSVLRDDFGPDSDVDVLLTLQPDHGLSLWDLDAMEADLQAIFGRRVDIVFRDALRNPFRRHEILTTAREVYAA